LGALEEGLENARHIENKAEFTVQLCAEVRPGDVVLIKASRGAAFEEVAEKLLVSLQADPL
jgi:UDP-N-acetylmuramyl pentapeptide synthase